MAAPLIRCACGAPLIGYCISTETCEECELPEADGLLDDPDQLECTRCETAAELEDLDEDGLCARCLEGDEERRQTEGDYRFWTR